MLKYDTVYQSLKKVSAEWHASIPQWEYFWYIIKFYENGTFVYSRTSEKGLENSNEWFTEDNLHITKGQYEYNVQKGSLKINFKDVSLNATITFNNDILLEGKLGWDMFTPIN